MGWQNRIVVETGYDFIQPVCQPNNSVSARTCLQIKSAPTGTWHEIAGSANLQFYVFLMRFLYFLLPSAKAVFNNKKSSKMHPKCDPNVINIYARADPEKTQNYVQKTSFFWSQSASGRRSFLTQKTQEGGDSKRTFLSCWKSDGALAYTKRTLFMNMCVSCLRERHFTLWPPQFIF